MYSQERTIEPRISIQNVGKNCNEHSKMTRAGGYSRVGRSSWCSRVFEPQLLSSVGWIAVEPMASAHRRHRVSERGRERQYVLQIYVGRFKGKRIKNRPKNGRRRRGHNLVPIMFLCNTSAAIRCVGASGFVTGQLSSRRQHVLTAGEGARSVRETNQRPQERQRVARVAAKDCLQCPCPNRSLCTTRGTFPAP